MMALVSRSHSQKAHLTDWRAVGIVQTDPYLEPFKDSLRSRYAVAQKWLHAINETEGGLEKFSKV